MPVLQIEGWDQAEGKLQHQIPIRLRPRRNLGISSASEGRCMRPSKREVQSLPQKALMPLATTHDQGC